MRHNDISIGPIVLMTFGLTLLFSVVVIRVARDLDNQKPLMNVVDGCQYKNVAPFKIEPHVDSSGVHICNPRKKNVQDH